VDGTESHNALDAEWLSVLPLSLPPGGGAEYRKGTLMIRSTGVTEVPWPLAPGGGLSFLVGRFGVLLARFLSPPPGALPNRRKAGVGTCSVVSFWVAAEGLRP